MRVNFVQAKSDLYINTSSGIIKTKNVGSPLYYAGLTSPSMPYASLKSVAAASPGVDLVANQYVAVRTTLCRYEPDGTILESAPSQPFTVKLISGIAGKYNLYFTQKIPSNTLNGYTIRFYRTKYTAAGVLPNDEMYLCYEKVLSPADIISGVVSISDISNDLLLGKKLYTNASVDGIEYANGLPPRCVSMSWFRNHMFYFNIKKKQRVTFKLIGTDLLAGDRITINGLDLFNKSDGVNYSIYNSLYGTYPPIATEKPGDGTFSAFFESYALNTSIDERIRGICWSIERAINFSSISELSDLVCYASEDSNGSPGVLTFERISYSDSPITVSASSLRVASLFDPPLNNQNANSNASPIASGGVISNYGQPEGVPENVTSFYCGDQNNPILMTHVIRDAIIIIRKTGIWICVGDSLRSFVFKELEPYKVFSGMSQCSCVFAGKVYALCDQGFVEITENGVSLLSNQENNAITLPLQDGSFSDNDNNGMVAIGHHEKNLILFCIPDPELYYKYKINSPAGMTSKDIFSVYGYNYVTQTYSRILINANCFTVANKKVYYGLNGDALGGESNKRVFEYRTLKTSDISPDIFGLYDDSGSITIESVDSATKSIVVKNADISYECQINNRYLKNFDSFNRLVDLNGINRGWLINNNTTNRILVLSKTVNNVTNKTTLFLNDTTSLSALAVCKIFRPIPVRIGKSPFQGSNPHTVKKLVELFFSGVFSNNYDFVVEYYNNMDYKKFPETTSYYSTLSDANNPGYPRRKSFALSDPLDQSKVQSDKLDSAKFYQRFLKAPVSTDKTNSSFHRFCLYNFFAGAFFELQSIGANITEENTSRFEYGQDFQFYNSIPE